MSAGVEDPFRRLRLLWDDHRRSPFPGSRTSDPRLQEVALYESWLGTIVESTLASGAVSHSHRPLLDLRRREGNPGLWKAAAEMGEPVRSYVARLIAIEDLVDSLPRGTDAPSKGK